MRDTYTYEELKSLTVADLREIAKGLHHDVVQGYTQMNKEHLLPAICAALGIDTHHHRHQHHAHTMAFDKSTAKAQVRALKVERDKVIAAGNHEQLKAIRHQIHTLKHRLRIASA